MKPTRIQFASVGMALVLAPLSAAQDQEEAAQFHVSSELDIPIVSVRGSGSNQSGLTRGTRFSHAWGVNGSGRNKGGEWMIDLRMRGTDDPRVNPQRNALDGLRLQYKSGRTQFAAGDVFENFSQYSLSSALKGASLKVGDDEESGTNFEVVYGNSDPRWYVFAPGEAGPFVHRTVVGAKVGHRLNERTGLAVSVVRATDSGRPSASDPLYKNTLVTFSGDATLPGEWKLDGELTWSDTREDPSVGAAELAYRGRGLRLQAAGPLGEGKATLTYENVSPEFYTAVGSATSDRERIRARYKQRLDPRTALSVGLIWYRNNLGGQLPNRTTALRPEFALSLSEVGGRPEATLDVSLTHDQRLAGTNRTDDTDLQFNYHDRLGTWDTDWNLGFARYFTRDARDSKELTLGTAWYSRVKRGDVVYRPSFSATAWKAGDSVGSRNDASYELGVGMGFEIPTRGLAYSVRTGIRRTLVDVGDSSSRWFLNGQLNYRPKAWRTFGGGMYLRVGWNDFRYTTGTRDYSEFNFGFGLTIEF